MKRLTNNKDETKNWQYLTNGGQLVNQKLSLKEDDDEELGVDSHLLFKAMTIKLASLYKNHKGQWVVKPILYDYTLTPKKFVESVLTKEERDIIINNFYICSI